MTTAAMSLGRTAGWQAQAAVWGVAGSRLLDPEYNLVSRCLGGDETAWEQFVRLHTRQVYALCYRFTGSGAEAQDLTQEVFLRVFRTLKSFRSSEGSLGTWPVRPDQALAGREASEVLQRALQKLSPDLREAVILRDLEEMEYREIAQVLEIPEGTVKSRINRGRAELGRLLRSRKPAL